MLNSQSCALFERPFFQFAQMKKFCPETIAQTKADYRQHWAVWKALNQAVSARLGQPFEPPHIEKWCNGWQVRAHFFAYYQYEFRRNSAAILSVILNRRRLLVSLDWHCYRADRSQISLAQYNQWLDDLDRQRYADFAIWHGSASEYDDFPTLAALSSDELALTHDEDFFCLGKSVERTALSECDAVEFISQTINDLLPLYERCHC